MNTHLVEWAEWLRDPSEEAEISNEIDYRTFRSKAFDDLKAALIFAKHKLEDSDEWLAILEVKEVLMIEKLK